MIFNEKISIGTTTVDANRYLGGQNRNFNDHPFVKGYFYVFFGVPAHIFGDANGITQQEARQFMLVSAESYTPPSDRQINLQDIQGQGGVDASFITGQTISREFSIQYRDYWGAPIFRIHRTWTNYINPYLGGSTIADTFSAFEYKGVCMVIQTKPIVRNISTEDNAQWKDSDIIKIDYFDGVQPMTDLKSAYDANITDNSFVKPTVQYKFDGFPLDETNKEVRDKAVAILNSKVMFDTTNKLYNSLTTTNNLLK